jgi:hypothetical protein
VNAACHPGGQWCRSIVGSVNAAPEPPFADRRTRAIIAALLLALASLCFPVAARVACPDLATSAAWQGRLHPHAWMPDTFDQPGNPVEGGGYTGFPAEFVARQCPPQPLPVTGFGQDPWGRSWWVYGEARPSADERSGAMTLWVHVVSTGPDGVFAAGSGDDIHPRNGDHHRLAVVRSAPLLLWLAAGLMVWLSFVAPGMSGRRRGAAALALGACFQGHVGVAAAAVLMAWLLALPRLVRAERSPRLEVEALRVLGLGLLPALVCGAIASSLDLPVPRWPMVSTPLAIGASTGSVVLLIAAMLRAVAQAPSHPDDPPPPMAPPASPS